MTRKQWHRFMDRLMAPAIVDLGYRRYGMRFLQDAGPLARAIGLFIPKYTEPQTFEFDLVIGCFSKAWCEARRYDPCEEKTAGEPPCPVFFHRSGPWIQPPR
ncbi:MAG: hypothetical protein IBJ11_06685 [Phycisphaerales bacterium]|nr:hypothetical protein [Phycisphaerales bacterium]